MFFVKTPVADGGGFMNVSMVNTSNGTSTITVPVDHLSQAVLMHCVFMLITWLAVVPFSMIVVQIGSKWDRWLPAHVGSVFIALITLCVGFAYGYMSSSKHARNPHSIFGIILSICFILQIVIGSLASRKKTIRRDSLPRTVPRIPLVATLHNWSSRILVLAAFVEIFLGYLATLAMPETIYIVTAVVQLFIVSLYLLLVAIF